MARPPKPAGTTADHVLAVRLTPADHALVGELVAHHQAELSKLHVAGSVTPADLVRTLLRREAERVGVGGRGQGPQPPPVAPPPVPLAAKPTPRPERVSSTERPKPPRPPRAPTKTTPKTTTPTAKPMRTTKKTPGRSSRRG